MTGVRSKARSADGRFRSPSDGDDHTVNSLRPLWPGMDGRGVVVRAVTALLVGASFTTAHRRWYRYLESSPVVDALGSVALGVVAAVACALIGLVADDASRRRVAAAFAVGALSHLLITPTVTPFGLSPSAVNAVLFSVGAAVGAGVLIAVDDAEAGRGAVA